MSEIVAKVAGFLFRRSMRAGEIPRSKDMRGLPERARPRTTQPIFGPADETIQDKAKRHFGEWDSQCDPLKHSPSRQTCSGESGEFFPKFSQAAESTSGFAEPQRDRSADGFLDALGRLVEEKRRR